jgi:hypothetical protein
LAPDLTPAFLQAAARAVPYGYTNTSDVIAAGALTDLAGFEDIVDEAVRILIPSAEELARTAEAHLDIVNAVYSDDYAEYLSNDDDGYTANEFLRAYVDHVRRNADWQRIPEHRHAARLLPYWLRSLRSLSRDENPDSAEVAVAFAMGLGHDEEDRLWLVVTAVGPSAFEEQLMRRVVDGHRLPGARLAALTCLVRYKPLALGTAVRGLAQCGREGRIVEIADEIGELRARHPQGEETTLHDALELAYGALEPKVQETLRPRKRAGEQSLAEPFRRDEPMACLRPGSQRGRPLASRADRSVHGDVRSRGCPLAPGGVR